MRMRITTIGVIPVLMPQGKLVAGEEADRLEAELKRLANEGVRDVVIDCSHVRSDKGIGLGVLISGHSNFVRRGGRFMLTCVSKKIENIFATTKLSLVFDVYPTVELAVAALTKSAPQPTHPERSPI